MSQNVETPKQKPPEITDQKFDIRVMLPIIVYVAIGNPTGTAQTVATYAGEKIKQIQSVFPTRISGIDCPFYAYNKSIAT